MQQQPGCPHQPPSISLGKRRAQFRLPQTPFFPFFPPATHHVCCVDSPTPTSFPAPSSITHTQSFLCTVQHAKGAAVSGAGSGPHGGLAAARGGGDVRPSGPRPPPPRHARLPGRCDMLSWQGRVHPGYRCCHSAHAVLPQCCCPQRCACHSMRMCSSLRPLFQGNVGFAGVQRAADAQQPTYEHITVDDDKGRGKVAAGSGCLARSNS